MTSRKLMFMVVEFKVAVVGVAVAQLHQQGWFLAVCSTESGNMFSPSQRGAEGSTRIHWVPRINPADNTE